jgi:hypothetical protein
LALALAAASFAAHGAVIDFEDLSLSPGSFYNGSDLAGGFASRGASFNNSFTDFGGGFSTWAQWSYSNVTDNTTAGYGNQYSAFAGGGAGGSANYGVSFVSSFDPAPAIILPTGFAPVSMQITNTTYTALTLRDGDPFGFAKKFGGVSGNDPDYLKLTITGRDALDQSTGSIDFYLADFRFADNSQDYIVADWTTVDLTSLGAASKLTFAIESSDNDPLFGINTPAYFAADNIAVAAVPEAGSLALTGVGLAVLAAVGRRRRAK